MRRKEDHLPRGVRWAVRVLRACGTMIILPALCLIPFALLPGLVRSGSSWVLDMLWVVSCLPVGLGGAMRVTATCIELSHDPSSYDSDPVTEWVSFAMTSLCVLAVGFMLGALVSIVHLGIAWNEKPSEVFLCVIHLILHLGLVFLLDGVSRRLAKWSRLRRKSLPDGF